MEEVDNQTFTNQFCKIHKRTRLCFASLSSNSQNPLMCSTCSIQNTKNDALLSIDEVLNADESEPITNWPPGIDTNSLEFLRCKETSVLKDRMRKGIFNFYDKLKQEINQILHASEKQQLMELDKTKFGSDLVIEFYNQIFKRNELNDIFKNKKSFDKAKYFNLLNSLQQTQQKDFEELSEKIKTMKDAEVKFRVFQESKIGGIFDEIIQQINEKSHYIFSNVNKEEMQDEDQNVIYEEYQCKKYHPQRENEDQLIIYNNPQEMQIKLNECQSKCLFLFSDYNEFEVSYSDNGHININNSQNESGALETQYPISFKDEISFKIKLDLLEYLENFEINIFTQDHRIYSLDNLMSSLYESQLKNPNNMIEFSVLIKNNTIGFKTQQFCQSDDISSFQQDDNSYYLQFVLESSCELVEIFDYKYTFAV